MIIIIIFISYCGCVRVCSFCGAKERSGNGETEPVEVGEVQLQSSWRRFQQLAWERSSVYVFKGAFGIFFLIFLFYFVQYMCVWMLFGGLLGLAGATWRGGFFFSTRVNGQNVFNFAASLKTSTFCEIIAIKNGACVCSCGAAERLKSREKAPGCMRVFTYFSSLFSGSIYQIGDHFLDWHIRTLTSLFLSLFFHLCFFFFS